jgi:predicted Fe-Mo cluster-binding NifX family protein
MAQQGITIGALPNTISPKETAGWTQMQMTTVAMPTYGSHVAPVFDSSDRFLVIQLKDDREVKRTVLYLQGLPHINRVGILKRVGVTTLICDGISEPSQTMLESSGIRVIWSVVGEVEEVFAAFMDKRLAGPQFYTPGRGRQGINNHNISQWLSMATGKEDTKRRENSRHTRG